ncbi:MAG: putative selenate reductase subunit YgfK [Candidatus Bipolaricaulota bacterium]|nr:putative selenate reductase subunit YgfK [Candidatus Bipolaricaulota bacterium]MDW8126698.1 putative selenate reductase subunit YgfK [Candidatus Bipolaricaulota bacterium]
MPTELRPLPFAKLLRWAITELTKNDSIFGIPRALFYVPKPEPFATEIFGEFLATPIGPSAGPHTQLSQNIVSAWLCGGRFIELKTVQILDELEIPRPCIDAADEGYNVEWSQELRLSQAAQEYIHAWVLIHILRRELGWENQPLGTVFNMSVGYNLAGITSPKMQNFMAQLTNAASVLAEIRELLRRDFPRLADIEIPEQITRSVTLSTMHGCPPNEIEAIVEYLLERGFHTFVKLNPTLLGKDRVMRILHDHLGFREIDIPDRVFSHDLQYEQALPLIRRLQAKAKSLGLTFGVKLTNTLAMANHRKILPGEEIYMSGRALYPITMNLFWQLFSDLDGDIHVSYSAGADALNLPTLISCGALPVTGCTDLLKPGGYGRFGQWLEGLRTAMARAGAKDLSEFRKNRAENLRRAAKESLRNPRYKKDFFLGELPKIPDNLSFFDCIAAPCVAACPAQQDVPEYVGHIAEGNPASALQAILARNPLPTVTGYVCPAFCEKRCTRWNYDRPVPIRAIKRYAAENVDVEIKPAQARGEKVAILGAGPAGLACAFYLALAGVEVIVFEAAPNPGGMISLAPAFRLPKEALLADVHRLEKLGVKFQCGTPLRSAFELLERDFAAVFLAPGFPREAKLDIPGEDGPGVYGALEFFRLLNEGKEVRLGGKTVVVGGGNTALDAARAACRLTGRPVTVIYRRSRAEMPAHPEEIAECIREGNELLELVSPVRILRKAGKVVGILCVRNTLGEPGPDGRRQPFPIPGTEFRIPCDSVILAVGQKPEIHFFDGTGLVLHPDGRLCVDPETGETNLYWVYGGGDAARGPSTVIEAIADGRRAAFAILRKLGLASPEYPVPVPTQDWLALKRKKTQKIMPLAPRVLPPRQRRGFQPVELPLSPKEAAEEAARCLQCRTICDKCVEVCPNRANFPYLVRTGVFRAPVIAVRNGSPAIVGEEVFSVTQERQILHIDDLCNDCGNCATFCVHQGKPYQEKPKFYISANGYVAEQRNAFFLMGDELRRREDGREMVLRRVANGFCFEDPEIKAFLDPNFSVRDISLKREFPSTRTLKPALEMALILEGVERSLPPLLEISHG